MYFSLHDVVESNNIIKKKKVIKGYDVFFSQDKNIYCFYLYIYKNIERDVGLKFNNNIYLNTKDKYKMVAKKII